MRVCVDVLPSTVTNHAHTEPAPAIGKALATQMRSREQASYRLQPPLQVSLGFRHLAPDGTTSPIKEPRSILGRDLSIFRGVTQRPCSERGLSDAAA